MVDLKLLKFYDGGFKPVEGGFEGSLSPLRDQKGHVVALKVVDPHRHKNFEYL